MGFASYHENIVSRQITDRYYARTHPRGRAPAPPERLVQEKPMENKLKEFTVSSARPLPVIVLADVSGSMSIDGKIQSLNQSLREMLESFRGEEDLRAEIHVAVITFGGDQVRRDLPLAPAARASWSDLLASGNTPMGAAFLSAKELLEDRVTIPGRAYRPTVVLVSDGQPTDEWKAPLDALLASERGSKAFRMALGIGADADMGVLSAFLREPEARVFRADEARKIRQFFRFVTMSVTGRSRSANPNVAPPAAPAEEWDL